MSNIIIAIDPGARHTGIAVFADGKPVGLRRISPTGEIATRLQHLGSALSEIARDCDDGNHWYPDEVVIEWPPYMAGRPGQRDVYAAAGAVIATLCYVDRIELVTPATWKRAICGVETAQKPQTTAVLRQHYAAEIRDNPEMWDQQHDVWDALGLGLYYVRSRRIEEKMAARQVISHV